MPAPRPSSATDAELVRQSMTGAHDAFGVLVTKHSRMVRAICMARIGIRDVDDAVQEVFLRAYRGLGRLQDPAAFGAFLGRIARNHCIDRLRTAPKAPPVSLEEIDLEPADARQTSDDARDLMLARLRKAVGRLPESQREVLLLFYFEQMSYAAMADALGITEAAVNQRLSRARQQLRSTLTRVVGDGEPRG